MEKWTAYTDSIEETHALGEKIGAEAGENMVVLLSGDLWACAAMSPVRPLRF